MELWAAHKTTGQTSIIDAKKFTLLGVIDTGLRTNHRNFVTTPTAAYAYVTVGGLNETQVYARNGGTPTLVKRIKDTGFEPHGIWPSPDNSRVYVVQQFSDKIDVIALQNTTGIVTESIRALQGADMVEIAAAGLAPDSAYTVSGNHAGEFIPLFSFVTDDKGAKPEAIAFLSFFGVYADRVVVSPGALATANKAVVLAHDGAH